MGITKKDAFKALAERARQRAGLAYQSQALLDPATIRDYLKSQETPYRNFAEAYDEITSYPRGGHPDYNHLAEMENVGMTEEGIITTLFLDLKNFTKYCCFLSPLDVFKAKHAVIDATIGVCRTYLGHLHEVPGDGVMFFFGGRDQTDTDPARRALNAAADTMQLLEEEVIPEYNNSDKYPSIYPKIGLDYGKSLWGAYGAAPLYEVKATAFNVDIAAKMMGQCNAKQIAIGDSLKEFLDVNQDNYLESGWVYDPQLTVQGEEKKFSYKTWLFNWSRYLKDQKNESFDLAKAIKGVGAYAPAIVKSRTTLGDAPLA